MGWFEREGTSSELFSTVSKYPRKFGVFPFVLNRNRIEVSKIHVFCDAALVSVLVACDIYMQIFSTESSQVDEGSSTVLNVLSGGLILFCDGTLVISLPWLIYRKSKIQEFIDGLIKFEEIVHPKALKVNSHLFLYLTIYLVCVGIANFTQNANIVLIIITNLRNFMMIVMLVSLISLYVESIRIITSAYQAIIDKINESHNCQQLKAFMRAAEHLVMASEAINGAFGPQALCMISMFFVLLTASIFLILVADEAEIKIIAAVWTIIYTKLLLHLVSSCSACADTVKKFNHVLYRSVIDDKTGVLAQELRLSLHFISNRRVEFTAIGFFTIDYTLVGSMAAASATYLVILIQIGNAESRAN